MTTDYFRHSHKNTNSKALLELLGADPRRLSNGICLSMTFGKPFSLFGYNSKTPVIKIF